MLSEKEIMRYFCMISLGLLYLQDKNIIHRDLKPENILVNESGILVIADFGLSKYHSKT
jgi:serine/threonine protein kinase